MSIKEIVAICQECGRECEGIEADTHRKCSGHNLWKLVIPQHTCEPESCIIEDREIENEG